MVSPIIACTCCARPFTAEESAAIACEEQELRAALMVNALGIDWACEDCCDKWLDAEGDREQERMD